MEMMSERERYENQVLLHDIYLSPEVLALRALIDQIKQERSCDE